MNLPQLAFRYVTSLGLVLFAFLFSSTCLAQEYKTYQKLSNNTLYFRWEPQSWEAFDQVVSGEMALEVFAVTGPAVRPELRMLEQKLIEPLPLADWLANLPQTNWDSSALTAVYVNDLTKNFRDETFLAAAYGDTPAEEKENRWQISNYVLNYSWPAIQNSGMGFALPLEQGVNNYAAKLYPTPAG
ncbi:MAG: hypothetical protein AAF840_05160, partial [Bacteroidota bacterium]